MTKEEIEHEELWTEGIIKAVIDQSNNNPDKFIINLKKVGYKVVKIESENERLKAEREWIKIDPNVRNTIPDEDVWTYRFQSEEVRFTPKGEYIPLGAVSYYMPLSKPHPPKQSPKKPICCEKYMRCQDCPSSPNYKNPTP